MNSWNNAKPLIFIKDYFKVKGTAEKQAHAKLLVTVKVEDCNSVVTLKSFSSIQIILQ